MRIAINHGHSRTWHVHQARALDQRCDAGKVRKRTCAVRQVIDRENRVSLAAAERGLKLNHWLPAFARETLCDLRKQQTHAFGDEGSLKKCDGVLVFTARLACVDGGDVGGEFGLLKGPFQDIAMRNGDFSPGLHLASLGVYENSVVCFGAGVAATAASMALQLVTISL